VAHLGVARVTNISRTMEKLKESGYWLVGLDERSERPHTGVDLTGPVGLVFGGEGKGLHELVRSRCDFLVSIPTRGPVRSLNVSVAAGIALFEVVRQRAEKVHGSGGDGQGRWPATANQVKNDDELGQAADHQAPDRLRGDS
jgi:23S rRNA (guanosine2251-2'-O)-methyltransferase